MIPIEREFSFWSSLRPLLLLARIIGIDLPLDKNRPNWCRRASIFWSLICFAVTISGIVVMLTNVKEIASFMNTLIAIDSQTDCWNIYINFGNQAVSNFCTHYGLVFLLQRRWIHLRVCFDQMEQNMKLERKKYSQYHRFVLAIVIFVTCMVSKHKQSSILR